MTPIYVNSDTLVEWDGLQYESDGSYCNNATMTFTLKDANGVAVAGATAITMSYVAASNGKYQGYIESTVALTVDAYYHLEITATRAGTVGFRRIPCQAQYRGIT